jgi:hypothetical protein FG10185.1
MTLWAFGSQLVLWVSWGAIESFGTALLLRLLYELPVPMLRLKRAPSGSLAAQSHWEAARMVVSLGYFVYCIGHAYYALPENAYTVLGVCVDAPEHEVRRHFRELARIYHPDKAGMSFEGRFLLLHNQYAVLSDSVMRFAYDQYVWYRQPNSALARAC